MSWSVAHAVVHPCAIAKRCLCHFLMDDGLRDRSFAVKEFESGLAANSYRLKAMAQLCHVLEYIADAEGSDDFHL